MKRDGSLSIIKASTDGPTRFEVARSIDERHARRRDGVEEAGRHGQAAPKAKKQAESETKTKRQPPYHVILLNDEEHTFEYVIELICKIFGHAKAKAEELTLRVHLTGRAIVLTTHRELAELKREQVLAYGPTRG